MPSNDETRLRSAGRSVRKLGRGGMSEVYLADDLPAARGAGHRDGADAKVIGVPVTLGATVGLGTPQVLFDLPDGAALFDMTGEAQRFLVGVPAGAGARANAATVIMNWQAGVSR